MVRAPCCEKMGLKKGPWTKEEDGILISHICKHGHGNWRALPKQAGLMRCGKSCRLRWINYLRPDIKRGNFSREEEDMIISLHELLGNRWSAIAARLPGRTDNEIKNVWHTHLKKRANQNLTPPTKNMKEKMMVSDDMSSPNNTCSEASSAITRESSDGECIKEESMESFAAFPEVELDVLLSMDTNLDFGSDDMSYWLDVFTENGGGLDLEMPGL